MKHKRYITTKRHAAPRRGSSLNRHCVMALRKRSVIRARHNHETANERIRDHYAPSLFGRYALVVTLRRWLVPEQQEQVVHACKALGAGTHKLVYATGSWRRSSGGRKRGNEPSICQIRLVSEDSLTMIRLCISDMIWRVVRVTGQKTEQA